MSELLALLWHLLRCVGVAAATGEPFVETMEAAEELELAARACEALAFARSSLVQDAFFGRAASPRSGSSVALAAVGASAAVRYDALGAMACRVARDLGPVGGVCGVRCGRSPEAYAAFYGVLAAGGAYLPVATASSSARQLVMLEGARAEALVVDDGEAPAGFRGRVAFAFAFAAAASVSTTDPSGAAAAARPEGLGARRAPGDPVYVMYTSGSSGRPKGVVVPHGGLVARVAWLSDAFGFRAGKG